MQGSAAKGPGEDKMSGPTRRAGAQTRMEEPAHVWDIVMAIDAISRLAQW